MSTIQFKPPSEGFDQKSLNEQESKKYSLFNSLSSLKYQPLSLLKKDDLYFTIEDNLLKLKTNITIEEDTPLIFIPNTSYITTELLQSFIYDIQWDGWMELERNLEDYHQFYTLNYYNYFYVKEDIEEYARYLDQSHAQNCNKKKENELYMDEKEKIEEKVEKDSKKKKKKSSASTSSSSSSSTTATASISSSSSSTSSSTSTSSTLSSSINNEKYSESLYKYGKGASILDFFSKNLMLVVCFYEAFFRSLILDKESEIVESKLKSSSTGSSSSSSSKSSTSKTSSGSGSTSSSKSSSPSNSGSFVSSALPSLVLSNITISLFEQIKKVFEYIIPTSFLTEYLPNINSSYSFFQNLLYDWTEVEISYLYGSSLYDSIEDIRDYGRVIYNNILTPFIKKNKIFIAGLMDEQTFIRLTIFFNYHNTLTYNILNKYDNYFSLPPLYAFPSEYQQKIAKNIEKNEKLAKFDENLTFTTFSSPSELKVFSYYDNYKEHGRPILISFIEFINKSSIDFNIKLVRSTAFTEAVSSTSSSSSSSPHSVLSTLLKDEGIVLVASKKILKNSELKLRIPSMSNENYLLTFNNIPDNPYLILNNPNNIIKFNIQEFIEKELYKIFKNNIKKRQEIREKLTKKFIYKYFTISYKNLYDDKYININNGILNIFKNILLFFVSLNNSIEILNENSENKSDSKSSLTNGINTSIKTNEKIISILKNEENLLNFNELLLKSEQNNNVEIQEIMKIIKLKINLLNNLIETTSTKNIKNYFESLLTNKIPDEILSNIKDNIIRVTIDPFNSNRSFSINRLNINYLEELFRNSVGSTINSNIKSAIFLQMGEKIIIELFIKRLTAIYLPNYQNFVYYYLKNHLMTKKILLILSNYYKFHSIYNQNYQFHQFFLPIESKPGSETTSISSNTSGSVSDSSSSSSTTNSTSSTTSSSTSNSSNTSSEKSISSITSNNTTISSTGISPPASTLEFKSSTSTSISTTSTSNSTTSSSTTPPINTSSSTTTTTQKLNHCLVCQSTNNVSLCTGCREAYYCSRECQKANWPQHKAFCKSKRK